MRQIKRCRQAGSLYSLPSKKICAVVQSKDKYTIKTDIRQIGSFPEVHFKLSLLLIP
jgi:hypothetical protein